MTSRMTHARTHDGATADRVLAAIGVLAGILTIVGLSGVGDAPAPQAEARSIADHFQLVRTDVFIGAIFGMVGVAAMTSFALGLALRLSRRGERAAALAVGAGLTVVVAYLLATHVVYATLSYEVAAMSADVTKGMFVATILAVPVFGLGVATLLVGTAVGSWRADGHAALVGTRDVRGGDAVVGRGVLLCRRWILLAGRPTTGRRRRPDRLACDDIVSAVSRRLRGLDQPTTRRDHATKGSDRSASPIAPTTTRHTPTVKLRKSAGS